jgi:hypothetical protein
MWNKADGRGFLIPSLLFYPFSLKKIETYQQKIQLLDACKIKKYGSNILQGMQRKWKAKL